MSTGAAHGLTVAQKVGLAQGEEEPQGQGGCGAKVWKVSLLGGVGGGGVLESS